MEYDLWFTRYDGDLFAVTCSPGEPPAHRPHRVASVTKTMQRIKAKGHKIIQVGIADPELLGLE